MRAGARADGGEPGGLHRRRHPRRRSAACLEGTVYNYLPVNIGDHLSAQRVREAIRALYATGFFRDVQLRRDGSTLVVVVLERPSIESFEITGNKDIKTEDLQKSLRNVGSQPARPSTARCSRTSPNTSPTSISPAASTA